MSVPGDLRALGVLAACAVVLPACLSEEAKQGIATQLGVVLAPLTLHPQYMAYSLERYYAYIYPVGTERAAIESNMAGRSGAEFLPGDDYKEVQQGDRIVESWGWSIDELRDEASAATPTQREAWDRWLSHATQDEYRFQVCLTFDKQSRLVDQRVEYLDGGRWVTFEDTGQFDDPEYVGSLWQPVWELMESQEELSNSNNGR